MLVVLGGMNSVEMVSSKPQCSHMEIGSNNSVVGTK